MKLSVWFELAYLVWEGDVHFKSKHIKVQHYASFNRSNGKKAEILPNYQCIHNPIRGQDSLDFEMVKMFLRASWHWSGFREDR